jgi:hypothetical protein
MECNGIFSSKDCPCWDTQACGVTGTSRMLRSAVSPFHRKSSLGFRQTAIVECAVNVPYGHNPPSISSYFRNLRETFRASVFWG